MGCGFFLLGLVIVMGMHIWLLGCGKVCVPFRTVLLHSAFCILRFRLFSCHLLLGYNGVAGIWSLCVGVGVRKALGLLWQARKRWMGMRLFRVSSGDARVAGLGFGCDPCSTYLGALQNLMGTPRERVLLLT